MDIVVKTADDSDGLDEHEPKCTCRPEYIVFKDGTRKHRHRIDPFCTLHGYHYRREIASAYCRSFNKRRFFSSFIVRLGSDDSAETLSWLKGYVNDLVKHRFDSSAVIKSVVHPDDENGHRHLHFGIGSDVGYVTWAAIAAHKSTRGRKPRLDLQAAWLDGNRRDQPWNWSAYVLRVQEGWRPDEKIEGRLRRCWRSRAEKGERIKAPTFADVVIDDKDVQEEMVDVNAIEPSPVIPQWLNDTNDKIEAPSLIPQVSKPAEAVLGWLLMPGLSSLACRYQKHRQNAGFGSDQRISPRVWGILQDGIVGMGGRPSPPTPMARPPPASVRSPPENVVKMVHSRT